MQIESAVPASSSPVIHGTWKTPDGIHDASASRVPAQPPNVVDNEAERGWYGSEL